MINSEVLSIIGAPVSLTLHQAHKTWRNAPQNALIQMHHEAGNVLFIARLNDYAALAYAIEKMLQTQGRETVFFASYLLRHEIERARQAVPCTRLVSTYERYLCALLDVPSQTEDIDALSGLIETDALVNELSGAQYDQIVSTWNAACQKLLHANDNEEATLVRLGRTAKHLMHGAQHKAPRALWFVAAHYLESLAQNASPTPKEYQSILMRLESVIEWQAAGDYDNVGALFCEAVLIELYLLVSELEYPTDVAVSILEMVDGQSTQGDFLTQVRTRLDRMMFVMADPSAPTLPKGFELLRLSQEFLHRGWTFFGQYAAQIAQDIEAKDADAWQISVQLQDLQNMVTDLQSHLAADDDNGAQDKLRRIRIDIEEAKEAFNRYLISKKPSDLPNAQVLEESAIRLTDSNLEGLSAQVEKLANVFLLLKSYESPLSYLFVESTADALSLIEMMLDSLAKGGFAQALLSQVQEALDTAYHALNGTIDAQEVFTPTPAKNQMMDVVHYDDSGEILPPSLQTTPECAAYEEARACLKADEFDFDADIKEIFAEEAKEVLEEIAPHLHAWQGDLGGRSHIKDIRRAFHTLKGSGRMVGAYMLGEMAWSIEHLLNHVLDGALEPNAQMAALVADALGYVDAMVDDFMASKAPELDPALIVLQAQNLVKGRLREFGLPKVQETDNASLAPKDVQNQSVQTLPSALLPYLEDAQKPLHYEGEIDEDIKEIFIEEAKEVLEEIAPKFAQYQHKEDRDWLVDVRRGFHTLKGSGRMVGALEIGELAWSIEYMLNRVLEGAIAPADGLWALVADVLEALPALVDAFEQGTHYPQQMALWRACGMAYAKGVEFDYLTVIADNADATPKDAAQGESNTLEDLKRAKHLIATPQDIAPKDDLEGELCDIFLDEAFELLAQVDAFLEGLDGTQVMVPNAIVRVFHTLRGASGLEPLEPIGRVAQLIEKTLQALQQHDEPLSQDHACALKAAKDTIHSYLTHYQNHAAGTPLDALAFAQSEDALQQMLDAQADAPKMADLIDGIDALLDADMSLANVSVDEMAAFATTLLAQIDLLAQKTQDIDKFTRLLGSLKQAYTFLQSAPQRLDAPLKTDLLDAHLQLTGLFDSLAGSMALCLDRDLLDRLDAKTTYSAGNAYTSQDIAQIEVIDTDPDLLAIFLDEVSELDRAVSESFAAWRAGDTNAQKALQRHLHTIKGGARMAGISSIGDLTHEAETVYELMADGRLVASNDWFSVMQQVQDILSLQIETVSQKGYSYFATQAVEDLRALINKKDIDASDRLTMPRLPQDDIPEQKTDTTEVLDEHAQDVADFNAWILHSWGGQLPDADILSVFLEEADEIAAGALANFSAFRANTGDLNALGALQRKLHTIKGGARMVAASGLADLAHEMESVYEDLAARRRPATRMVANLLMACHDWMMAAVLLLKQNYNPPRPNEYIQALSDFSRNPDSLTEVPNLSLVDETTRIANFHEAQKARLGQHDISKMPPMTGTFTQNEDVVTQSEMIRISSDLMERLINLSGEAAINRARVDMTVTSLVSSIEEMGTTVQRLADQLRRMDIELEAQILAQVGDSIHEEFDPLEMDQYSALNQLSKSLSESASDLLDIKATLLDKTRDGESLLLQLSRTQTELQDGLMHSRMVPFSRLIPRLQRIIRQTASELGKQVELSVIGADDEMDRTILERITSPLEHMLRNAVDHGIEMPSDRVAAGKPPVGKVLLEILREGNEIVVKLSDDGAGINVDAVRQKAIKQNLIADNDASLTDVDIMQYIFNAGLSTTSKVTQISGRGVGMDVVRSEIRQLGGIVSVDSQYGSGSEFILRVPLTVAVSDALVVRAQERTFAIPLVQIERVVQVSKETLGQYYAKGGRTLKLGGINYRARHLSEILSNALFDPRAHLEDTLPVIIIKNQMGQNLALSVDEIVGSRIEMVVKPLGQQLSHLQGISAATIMGDGSIMLILDLTALMRTAQTKRVQAVAMQEVKRAPSILVVDDSVTVRKVTSRVLERRGYEVTTAKDGVDALEILGDLMPDVVLLDIEMPRMDGFEVATQIRRSPRLAHLPIIMITSRTGEKHRDRAMEIGVNDYMGKPFQETDLLPRIESLLRRR